MIRGRNRVGFQVGLYGPAGELMIDPTLTWSTYYGGSGTEQGTGIAVDSFGNTYVTGVTTSVNFPSIKPLDNTLGGTNDAFVLKLSPTGTVISATYLGGAGNDAGTGIAVDNAGRVYITGTTDSSDFPTENAFQAAPGGSGDSFITVLNASCDQILWSSYLGGGSNDSCRALAVDANGNVWLTGVTRSVNFPLVNPLQNESRGNDESFAVKVGPAGNLLFSTYLGGGGNDRASGIGVDATGDVYLSGATDSADYPATSNSLQPIKRAGFDAFVTKINKFGSRIVYSTFLGGSADEGSSAIAVDSDGRVFITGGTSSTDFPTTPGALQRTYAGGSALGGDAFIAKLDTEGARLIYSSYLGGSGPDGGRAIAVDLSGNAYIAGSTAVSGSISSQNFPLVNPILPRYGGGFFDGFLTIFNPTGTAAVFSTYLGGNDGDSTDAVAIDLLHNVYAAGFTLSTNFPVLNGAQSLRGGSLSDLFVTKISDKGIRKPLSSVSAASYIASTLSPESIVAGFGQNISENKLAASSLPLPVSLGGTSVTITDSSGRSLSTPLFFVSPEHVNYLIPAGLSYGPATVTLFSANGTVASGQIELVSVAPGLFAANSDGQGVAAAVALRLHSDGTETFEAIARFDETQNKFIAIPIDLGQVAERVFLQLFGTGIRGVQFPSQVSVKIGGVDAEVLYTGPQGSLAGLDQVNVLIPKELVGRGEVAITLTTNGRLANSVTMNVR